MHIATDPPVSESQRRAMFAAAGGHSTLGIPEKVGKEFVDADKGGALPQTAKDMTRGGFRRIFEGLAELVRFFGEEEKEPEHQPQISADGKMLRWPGSDEAPKGRAASIAFVTKDGRTLLLRRSKDEANFPSHWAFPGGGLEADETFEDGARRECKEEIGDCALDGMKVLDAKRTQHGWDHVTYVIPVKEPFDPRLNGEHDDYAWAPITGLPSPMHPAVQQTIEDAANGKLSQQERATASPHEAHREGMPDDAFLEPGEKKYPVKVKRDGAWHYDRDLLLAAAREARMHHHEALAARADTIRKREFEGGSDMAMDYASVDWTRAAVLVTKEYAGMAFDKASVREKDRDGRMRVSEANITKANVCPYQGKEIPDWEKLGLDPNKRYMLLRDPDELKKAVHTFNNLPIMSDHVPVTSREFPQNKVIGATGSNAQFDGLHMKNSLVFWPQSAIDDIESDKKKELSAGYRYRADMRPGVFKGIPFDGVMRDIEGNHMALVREGRVGADVVVGDTNVFSQGNRAMPKKLTQKSARVVVDALKRRGLLALDAAPEEAAELVGQLEGLEEADEPGEDEFDPNSGLPSYMDREDEDAEDAFEKPEEVEEFRAADARTEDARKRLGRDETPAERESREEREAADAARKRLGRDENEMECMDRRARMGRDRAYRAARDAHHTARDRLRMRADDVRRVHADMRRADDAVRAADTAGRDKAQDSYKRASDALKMSRDALRRAHDECRAARDARRRARDARRMGRDSGNPEAGPMSRGEVEDALRARDLKHQHAMDAALAGERERTAKANEALRLVRPVVGEMALDAAPSADDVYRGALKILGVKTDGVHASAYPELFRVAASAKQAARPSASRFAMDSSDATGAPKFEDMFPGAAKISAI